MSEYRSRTEKRRARETARKGNKNTKKRRKKKSGALKKSLVSALIVMLVAIIGGTATAVAMISNAPPIDADELVFAEGSTIYDQDDNEIFRLQGTENRTYRDISEMPEHMKDAFIAVEDYRFYDHMGIDVRRIGGAITSNITQGFGSEGASTITQQLVKQAFLSTDQTIERKVQEQWLSVRMEQQYSKDEILEMYLNINYFDESAWGVGEAAIRYFNKDDLSELTVADSAALAAIPRRPSYYNPESNPENAEERRNLVISLMEEQELITGDEAAEARAVDIEDQLDYTPAEDEGMYESFVDQVMNEVENIEGIESADLYAAGFDIYTTLDPDAQAYAEDVIQTDDYIAQYPDNEDFQVGFTLLDTETGALRAMVGNRQETDEQRGWNHASTGGGQPGSTIKPILDYGPAIDYQQWSTGEPLVDEPHSYTDVDETEVTNYGGGYSGEVTMREALVRSLNIPAVKAIQEVGTDDAQAFAEGLGLDLGDEIYESYALGGTEEGVPSLDMAGAYAAFGNDGVYNEPHAVRKIEFRDGREIEFSPESERAMNDYTAYMISDMLKGVVSDSSGTGQRANIEGLPLAGKTGTSNFDKDQRANVPEGAVPDVWFNGYTTDYTAAVWTGHSNRGDGYLAAGEEQQIARDIFRIIMSNVHEGEDTADFSQPNSVCESEMEEGSGQLPSDFTPSNEITTELFICGNEPQETSDTYEVDASISELDATYDEEDEEIVVSWDFPEDEADDVTFSVSHDPGDGMSEVADSDEQEYVLSEPESGEHSFEVVATQDGNSIDSAETSVDVPDGVEDDEDDPDEDEEGRTEDEDDEEDDEEEEEEEEGDGDEDEDEDDDEDNENDEEDDEDDEDDDDDDDDDEEN
ncbi:PBP1A family penicillin-binding protein [Salicibibacter cibi]|uniref:PBP1A family penicillin-binding protein n=1 Tax=Salicibibacter cibi TaxID=2743001 RepID=A0A7T6ZAM4_9BACI|nr:PBP1A family penicillin-binding protein [Salicibibacter cibi]QQK79926.1 PBP1A family penicillin-binding protein [Salicibibacter cibi]